MKIFSPLEQFEILPIFFLFFDFSITNQVVILCLIVFLFIVVFFIVSKETTKKLFLIPNRFQSSIEIVFSLLLNMVIDNIIGKGSEKFFPLIFTLFTFISSMNLIGLIPYSYTITSHFIVTLTLSSTIFIGICIICFRIHKLELFSLFLPSGTSVSLSFLLVPVELISFFFKPLSLAVRLFCNMMAGHTLLKVFAGFSWSLMSISGLSFFMHYVPLIVLIPLYGLELGVALIQAFVFSLLTCIYLNDSINLH